MNAIILEETTGFEKFNEWMSAFVENFENTVGNFALLLALIIEIFGIVVIVIGVVKAFICHMDNMITKTEKFNIVIDLGKALSLGLEFKMGAEILKTVIVKTVDELLVLGAVILLRAILAVLIHWEITNEKKEKEGIDESSRHFGDFFKKKKKPEITPVSENNEKSPE